ncbi:hypothetical protein DFQ05_0307 [Winogradskyella wandonensis]|uniref:Uncharacterized protein n=1 Tax=Winogradskyella wandonensis TaxID=1442586 RepID=A0A4R1KVP9_9FLAO|nr:hypothetical protein [Winogradskyella wandonensis]TCK68797.1 hypothetical protein DFQ05_0307 [Winogradskyella wandonensis]
MDLKTTISNHLKSLTSIQYSSIEGSMEQLNSTVKVIRSYQDYYIKVSESYKKNHESINHKIASKLTVIKIALLKSKNEQRLFLSTGKLKHKNNYADSLQKVIEELKELQVIIEK